MFLPLCSRVLGIAHMPHNRLYSRSHRDREKEKGRERVRERERERMSVPFL